MFDLLKSIIDTAIACVSFLVNTFTSLVDFIIHIPTYVSFLSSSITVLPGIVLPFVAVCISTYVVFFLINRR